MNRKNFMKLAGLSAFAMSTSGFTILQDDGTTKGDCATTTDYLGPFYREGAPFRNDLTYPGGKDEIPLKVVGQLFGADCQAPIPNALINVWHCDHEQHYDMETQEFRCYGRFYTNENGEYWFKSIIPPPVAGRPKHIHFLVKKIDGYKELVTQLYFRGDERIKSRKTIKGPRDERRILEIYKNEESMAEVKLDLYLSKKGWRF
ncbi:hypothetical protein QQ020_07460 [Fulvivirgaceae bacterium BMA12]|uniref:Intradiol ring-cleavage dioxygenases domain-containing protein n=1 Tax=Agaribacillus aureus TaxID=3051825 RepID=A0ABT8L2A3_9BACT|nr:hypothetical protein [Fulvivirgaceae bacterium BMA12]